VTPVSQLSKKTKRLLAPREKFLVLEVTPAGTNALFLNVDEDNVLTIEKTVHHADLKKLLNSPLRSITQKSWEGKYLFKSRRKVIVSADPSLATTMPIPLDLSRDRAKWKDEITLEELENLIAQAMQKVFTQCRSEAAKRLGVDDIHTILVGAKVNRFKVDGHAVMNPIEFTGKKISLLLELTFTSRDVFENLKQFFSAPDEFFFIESPQATLLSVARARDLPLSIIMENRVNESTPGGHAGSSLFVFQKVEGDYPVLYREPLPWSFASIFRRIADEFGVSEEVAEDLYLSYRRGEMSEAARRGFKKAIQPVVDALFAAISKAKLTGMVYIDTPHPLPFDVPHKAGGAKFEELPVQEILTELGLQADPGGGKGLSDSEIRARFRNLAPFLESYFAKSTSEINQKLRRRLHWLAD
jgi:hypothetical protein